MQVNFTSAYKINLSKEAIDSGRGRDAMNYFVNALNSSDEDILKENSSLAPKHIRRVMHHFDDDYRRPKLRESNEGTDRGASKICVKGKTYVLTGKDHLEYEALKKELADKNATAKEIKKASIAYKEKLIKEGRMGRILLSAHECIPNEEGKNCRITSAIIQDHGQSPNNNARKILIDVVI